MKVIELRMNIMMIRLIKGHLDGFHSSTKPFDYLVSQCVGSFMLFRGHVENAFVDHTVHFSQLI